MSYCRQCGKLLTPDNTSVVEGRVYCADCAASLQTNAAAPKGVNTNSEDATQAFFTPPVQPQTPPAPPQQAYAPPAAPVYAAPPMRRLRNAEPNKWARIVRGMAIAFMIIGSIACVVAGIMIISGGSQTANVASRYGASSEASAIAASSGLTGTLIMILGPVICILSQAAVMMSATMAIDVNEIKQEVMTINDKQP